MTSRNAARRDLEGVPPSRAIAWALAFGDRERKALLVVPGDREERLRFYDRYLVHTEKLSSEGAIDDLQGFSWTNVGVLENVITRIATARVSASTRLPVWFPPEKGVWELLWSLVAVEDIVIGEPLRTLVDNSTFLAHHLYRLLWEARFLAKEKVNLKPAQVFVELIVRWLTAETLTEDEDKQLLTLGVRQRVQTDSQRFDLLCMLVSLAEHNGFISRLVLAFDDLEKALVHPNRTLLLRRMSKLLDSIDRWIKVGGSPIGVLIGFEATPESMTTLREHHPRLADHVREGLVWTEE